MAGRWLATLAEVGLDSFIVAMGERFPWQITLFFWSNAAGVPIELPLQVIHKAQQYSEYNMMNLAGNVRYFVTDSGYQTRVTLLEMSKARGGKRHDAMQRRALTQGPG